MDSSGKPIYELKPGEQGWAAYNRKIMSNYVIYPFILARDARGREWAVHGKSSIPIPYDRDRWQERRRLFS